MALAFVVSLALGMVRTQSPELRGLISQYRMVHQRGAYSEAIVLAERAGALAKRELGGDTLESRVPHPVEIIGIIVPS